MSLICGKINNRKKIIEIIKYEIISVSLETMTALGQYKKRVWSVLRHSKHGEIKYRPAIEIVK